MIIREGAKRLTGSLTERIEQIVEDHGDDVLRYAYLYLGNREWAEDASQQVFLRAYQNLRHYRGEASMKTWVLRIAVNVCKNIRGSRAYKKAMAECPLDALESHTSQDHHLVSENKEIWQKVLLLPDKYCNVVLLKYYHGYKTEEIAGLLKLTPTAVRSRLSRAMEKLREDMEGGIEPYESEIAKQPAQHRG
jgi:RNA polymerase sigma-70 factor (ECF subfamily)